MRLSQIVGIDPALTSTGLAVHFGQRTELHTVRSSPIPAGQKFNPSVWSKRIETTARTIAELVPAGSIVGVEGAAFAARYGNPDERAGLRWSIVARIRARGCEVVFVPPSSAKMWLTGSGSAGKKDMISAAAAHLPGIDNLNEHTADAFAIMSIAAEVAGIPVIEKPARAAEVLKKIQANHLQEMRRK